MRIIVIILLVFFGSSIVAKNVSNEYGYKVTRYACVGIFHYSDGEVENNFLTELYFEESEEDPKNMMIKVGTGGINSYDAGIQMFENTSSHITASSLHPRYGDKEFIRFDKKSGEVLKVDNYRNGRSAKFEGECF